MQLPLEGHPLHTRSLTIMVSLREDGRWLARGDVIDLRKCSFVPMMQDLQPAGIIHQMVIEAVVDPATRRLDDLEIDQPHVAVEPSERTGGECCRDPAPRLRALIGETLDAGFAKKLSAHFGGPLGCSHLLTLFQLMASALPRAFELEEALQSSSSTVREPGERLFRRGAFVDGHEMSDDCIGLGVQLADYHTRPTAAVHHPLGWLERQDEARVHVRVESPSQRIRSPEAAERTRSAETLADAEWQDRSALLAELEGVPVVPGLAGRLFRILGGDPERRRLLDAALQLAPGLIQVLAAVTERWFVQMGRAAGGEGAGAAPREAVRGPDVASVGGTVDSCYMWRSGGPMLATRERIVARRGAQGASGSGGSAGSGESE